MGKKGMPARFLDDGDTTYIACNDVCGWLMANSVHLQRQAKDDEEAALIGKIVTQLMESFGTSWMMRDLHKLERENLGGDISNDNGG